MKISKSMTNLKYHFSLLGVLVLLLMSSVAFGQAHDASHDDGYEFKKFRVAVNWAMLTYLRLQWLRVNL